MSGNPQVKISTTAASGQVAATVVAMEDDQRTYLGLYSQTGNCIVSFGSTTNHSTEAITIAQGNLFEAGQGFINNVVYSGAGTTLLILSDIESRHLLLSDSLPLTYDSEYLYYGGEGTVTRLSAPVFS